MPYGVKAEKYTIRIDGEFVPLANIEVVTAKDIISLDDCPGYTIKPYLFPLSSMTKEQESYVHFNTKFRITRFENIEVKIDEDDNYFNVDEDDWLNLFDWFNKNHFDYRGLIPMGLAENAMGKNIY